MPLARLKACPDTKFHEQGDLLHYGASACCRTVLLARSSRPQDDITAWWTFGTRTASACQHCNHASLCSAGRILRLRSGQAASAPTRAFRLKPIADARMIWVRYRSHATYSRQTRQVRKEATVTGSCVCSEFPVSGFLSLPTFPHNPCVVSAPLITQFYIPFTTLFAGNSFLRHL